MKTQIIIGIIILISFCATGQTNTYHKASIDLGKYEGTWVGVKNGTDTFKIWLEYKHKFQMAKGIELYQDMLIGCFTYSENGNIIDGYGKCNNLEECYNIRIGSGRDGRVGGSILDINKRNGCAVFSFTLNPKDQNKAIWKISQILYAMDEGSKVFIGEEGQRQLDSINNNPQPPQAISKITSIEEWQMVRVSR